MFQFITGLFPVVISKIWNLKYWFFYGSGEGNVRYRSPVKPVARALPCATFGTFCALPNPDEGSHPHHFFPNKKAPKRGFFIWSGWRESNPRIQLGKLLYYHCTTSATSSSVAIFQLNVKRFLHVDEYARDKIPASKWWEKIESQPHDSSKHIVACWKEKIFHKKKEKLTNFAPKLCLKINLF